MTDLYFAAEQDAIPPEAERCPDASRSDGRCRHAVYCSHQRNHQHIAGLCRADLLATCPWTAWFRQRVG